MNSSEQKTRAIPERPRADYHPEAAGDPPGLSSQRPSVPVRDQVEQLLRRGLSNKSIAAELRIGVPLVAYYLRRIYRDAGVSNEREYFTRR